MKEYIEVHKQNLVEEKEQLQAMFKVALEKREEIFALTIEDDSIKKMIQDRDNEINELNQILQPLMCPDDLTDDNLREIWDRFQSVKKHIKHNKRRDI